MRHLIAVSSLSLLSLTLASCGGGTKRPVVTVAPQATPKAEQGDLIGRTRDNLVQNLGPVALEIREGDGLKLQWRGSRCVLDAYLYPGQAGEAARVAHVDARDGDGRDVAQAGCIEALLKR